MNKIFFLHIFIFILCYSETATGSCSDPVCDSINVITIYEKLGVDIEKMGDFYNGERIKQFYFRCFIDTFPEEIGNLTELTKLTIGGQLSPSTMKHLPASIGNLTKLEYLDVSNNQLEELPPEIGRLVNLKELFLQRNNLTTLPDSIVNITHLDPDWDVGGYRFDVGWNHICSLPPPVRLWVDSMYFGGRHLGSDYVYSGAWKGMQCNDCPDGNRICETSIREQKNKTLPKLQAVPASGYLFDLRGRRIGIVAGRKDISRFPKGCYIVRYGGTVQRYRRIAVP